VRSGAQSMHTAVIKCDKEIRSFATNRRHASQKPPFLRPQQAGGLQRFIRYTVELLPVQSIGESETPVQFAGRVQRLVASRLGIAATSYSFKDALALRQSVMADRLSVL